MVNVDKLFQDGTVVIYARGWILKRRHIFHIGGGKRWAVACNRNERYFPHLIANGLDWSWMPDLKDYKDRWIVFPSRIAALEKRDKIRKVENAMNETYEYKVVPI